MADDMGWSDQLAVFDRGEFEAAARETAGEVNTTLCLEGGSSIRFGSTSDSDSLCLGSELSWATVSVRRGSGHGRL